MSWATPLLDHGGFLLAGGSAFLALGLLVNLLQRAPLQRMRIAELAIACSLLFVAITFAPLPRPLAPEVSSTPAPMDRFDLGPMLNLIDEARALQESPVSEPPIGVAEPETNSGWRVEESAKSATTHAPVSTARTHAVPAEEVAPLPWKELALGFWLGGAALSATWLLLGAFRVRRLLRRSRRAPRPVIRLLRDHGVQLPKRVRLRISDQAVRPFCVGLIRPTIVIPRELLDDDQVASLAPVLHHEIAHATQRDARGLWLFALAQVPLWFHPLFWWLRAQHRFATELIADAIAAGNSSNRAYARDLVHLVERQAEESVPVVGATALFRKRSDFYQRMQMLLTRTQPLATRTTWRRRTLHGFLSLALLTGASSLGGTAPLLAQEPVNDPQEVIAQLRAENTQLRADLAEMRAVMREMQQVLVDLRDQTYAERAALEFLHQDYVLNAARNQQHAALGALGYLAVEEYTVKPGDSVSSLLESRGINTQEALEQLNSMNPDADLLISIPGGYRMGTIKPGQSLMLPAYAATDPELLPDWRDTVPSTEYSAITYVVQAGDSLYQIAKKYDLMTKNLQMLFYALNADTFGGLGPDQIHGYTLSVGQKLKVPVAGGDGEVVATSHGTDNLVLHFEVNQRNGNLFGQDQLPADTRSATDAFSDTLGVGGGSGGDGFADSLDENGVPMLQELPLLSNLFDEQQATSMQIADVDLAECMEIAFRLIDLEGEMMGKQEALEYSMKLQEQGLVSKEELQREEIAVVTLQRKIRLARRVVHARISDYEQQIEDLQSRYKDTHPAYPRRQIEARKQAIALLHEAF